MTSVKIPPEYQKFSPFSVANDMNCLFHLNNDLKILKWVYQWKMSFNSDISIQVQEVTFSRKVVKASHSLVFFNNIPATCCSTLKNLDERPNLGHHMYEQIAKTRKWNNVLPSRNF